MKIAIGADHGGYNLKKEIINELGEEIEFINFGTDSIDSVDYPIIAKATAKAVSQGECELGILICRTGVGMSICANKVKGIRCALCYNEEVAKLCREHNNANMLALPADQITKDDAIKFVKVWLDSKFLSGRHENRVNMIEE